MFLFYFNHYCNINNKSNIFFLKKRINSSIYLPIRIQSIGHANIKVFSNNQINILFNKYNIEYTKNIINLFYDFGFFKKKFTILTFKSRYISLSTILTSLIFKNLNTSILINYTLMLLKKQQNIKKGKLHLTLKKLKLYGLFILDLPKSKKLFDILSEFKLLTIGFSNNNYFNLNLPIVNNWISYKLLYVFYLYDSYRIGLSKRYLDLNKHIYLSLKKLTNLFI